MGLKRQATKLFLSLLRSVGGKREVKIHASMSSKDLAKIGLDGLDIVIAAVSFEIIYGLDIPDHYLKDENLSVAQLISKALTLPRHPSKTFTRKKVQMLARCWGRLKKQTQWQPHDN
jgi:hypothetical protein